MDKKADARAELEKSLLRGYLGFRAQSSGQDFQNLQADVVVMLGHCMRSIASACINQSWPELFELMAEGHEKDELLEEVRQMHLKIGSFLERIDTPLSDSKALDATIYETLEAIKWEEVPLRARTTWLAMLGLYHLSRVWVISRQRLALGMQPAIAFDTVAQSAGHLMRMYDQNLSPKQDAIAAIRAATQHAVRCGVDIEDLLGVVRETHRNTDPREPLAEADLHVIRSAS
jgi:hypothetical protein